MNKDRLRNELFYFLFYYKWLLGAALIVFIVIGSFFAKTWAGKECGLYVSLISCHTDADAEDLEEDFKKAAGDVLLNGEVQILTQLMFDDAGSGNYAMTSLSRFMTDVGSKRLDVCGMREKDFVKYEKSGTWADLGELLTDEEIESIRNLKSSRAGSGETGPFVRTEDGKIVGIYADYLPVMNRFGCYDSSDSRGVIGIIYNSGHPDTAVRYLIYAAQSGLFGTEE